MGVGCKLVQFVVYSVLFVMMSTKMTSLFEAGGAVFIMNSNIHLRKLANARISKLFRIGFNGPTRCR